MPPSWSRFDVRQAGRKIALVLLIWLGLNVLFAFFFVRPRIRELAQLTEQSQPRLQAVTQRQKQVKNREEFLQALRQVEADLKTLRHEVLGTRARAMVPVQLELSALAQQFSINLEQVEYQNSELEEEALERFAMIVPLEAGYGNLRRFLQAVEKSKKFLVVERVALGQTPEGGVLLQLNITLATYFDAPHLKREDRRRDRRDIDRRNRPGPQPVPRRT